MKKISLTKGIGKFSFPLLCLFLSCTDPNTNTTGTTKDSTATVKNDSNAIPTKPVDTVKALDSTKKYVFLTFDDGPQPGTENVMQSIRETGVKASFFMIGIHATFSTLMRSYVDTIRNAAPEFILVNHSYTHAFNDRYLAFYHHPEAAYADFMKADSALKIPYHIFRFPGNDAWVITKGKLRGSKLVRPTLGIIDSIGGKVIGWDVEWHFKRNPSGPGSVPIQSATAMANTIVRAMEKQEGYSKNQIVMLAHDRMFHQANYKDSLVKMITLVKEEHPEYQFETVEKL